MNKMHFKCRECGTTSQPVAEPVYYPVITGIIETTGADDVDNTIVAYTLECIECLRKSRAYSEEVVYSLGMRDLTEQTGKE